MNNNISYKLGLKLKFMFKSKRGISPLIATVLLIAFAVALGAVVMNWGRSYVEETARQSGITSDTRVTCAQQVNLEVVQVGRVPRICYNSNERVIDVTMTNSGDVEILGVLFNVLGENGVAEHESDFVLGRGRINKYSIDYDISELGSIEFVQAIPKVRVRGSATPAECSDSNLQWENIPDCDDI